MGKKSFAIIGSVFVVVFGLIIFKVFQPAPVWETNARQFSKSFNAISGNTAIIEELSSFTAFEWDALYSFAPYTPEKIIYEVVGYRWDKIHSTVNEGMNQIVFLKDDKVVCYIDGYPDKYKVFFSFGGYNGNYYKLSNTDKLVFRMTVINEGVRMFEYVK